MILTMYIKIIKIGEVVTVMQFYQIFSHKLATCAR